VSDELLAGIKSSLGLDGDNDKKVQQKFYGVTVGTVMSPLDPLMLGRLQVRLPFIDSLDFMPWARVATMMAGPLHGTYFIPNPGDDVLVAFEHGDVSAPYILGSVHNMISRPALPSPIPATRSRSARSVRRSRFRHRPLRASRPCRLRPSVRIRA
jgi:hypothetical protein